MKKFIFALLTIFFSFAFAGEVSAASFRFNPINLTAISECSVNINIDIDTQGQQSNAADIIVIYNPSDITINDSNPDLPGIQIRSGNAYEAYFGNTVDPVAGEIRLTGASIVSSLSGVRNFATINFTGNPGVTSTNFQIRFDGVGATLDSNIAELVTSQDILNSVTNATVTFNPPTNCRPAPPTPDRTGPEIAFVSPSNSSQSLPENQILIITISDSDSGVNLNSIRFQINDVELTATSPGVSVSGTAFAYTFEIDASLLGLNPDAFIVLRVSARDNANNQSLDQLVFNIPTYQGEAGEELVCFPVDTDQGVINSVLQNTFGTNPDGAAIDRLFRNTPLENTVVASMAREIGLAGAVATSIFILLSLPFLIFALPVLLRRIQKDDSVEPNPLLKVLIKILEYLVVFGFTLAVLALIFGFNLINLIIWILYVIVLGTFVLAGV